MSPPSDHFALDWIRADLLQTLEDARASLEAYADSGDATRMRMCLTGLHQLHGTLLMLELDGVTCLADHLEQLAQSLTTDAIDDAGAAQQCLMQGILELPGYLDDLHKGGRDSRLPMLPLVNQARALLGHEALEMPGGSSVNVHAEAPAASLAKFGEIDGPGKVKRIRAAYQQVLLSILRGEDRPKAVATLQKVAGSLERVCADTPLASLWQAFGLFADSLAAAPDHLDNDAVKLLRRVDAEIRGLAADGVELLRRPVPVDLVRSLLLAARDRDHDSALADGLEEAIDAQPGIESLRLSGQEAMSSAAIALREEIAEIRDALDLFVRSDDQSPSALAEITAPLKQISSTLSLLGFESSRAMVIEQLDAMAAGVDVGQADPDQLQSLATALVQVDSNLSVYAEGSAPDEDVDQVVADAHRRVLTETRSGLDHVKQQLVGFVSSQWDRSLLAEVPGQLVALQSALSMLTLTRAGDQLGSCAAYVAERLLGGTDPDWQDLDHFADVVSGVDYFLERLGDGSRSSQEGILDRVDESLAELGFKDRKFDPAAVSALEAAGDALASSSESDLVDPEPELSASETLAEPPEPRIDSDELADSAATTESDVRDNQSADGVQGDLAEDAGEPDRSFEGWQSPEQAAEERLEARDSVPAPDDTSSDGRIDSPIDSPIDSIDANSDGLIVGLDDDVDADLLIELDDESDLAEFDLEQLSDGLASEALEEPQAASLAAELGSDTDDDLIEDTSQSEAEISGSFADVSASEQASDAAEEATSEQQQADSAQPLESVNLGPEYDLSDGLELTEITAEELGPPEELLPEQDLTLHEQNVPTDEVADWKDSVEPDESLDEPGSGLDQAGFDVPSFTAQAGSQEAGSEDREAVDSVPEQGAEPDAESDVEPDPIAASDLEDEYVQDAAALAAGAALLAGAAEHPDVELELDALAEGAEPSPAGDAASSTSLPAATSVSDDERDDEIIEIFAEEVGEVLEAIAEALPAWRNAPLAAAGDDALTEIRRAFHTLKGSGRIVGANDLGEAAWAVENLLNRKLEGTLEHSDELFAVVERASDLMASACDAFVANQPADSAALESLIDDADLLASGGSLSPDQDASAYRPGEDRLGDDETVRELFLAEAEELVGELEAAAVADELKLDERFMRAAHTLTGSAAAAEVASISALAGALERLVEVASSRPPSFVSSDVQFTVRDAVFALRRQLSDLSDEREPELVDEIIAQLDEHRVGGGSQADGRPSLLTPEQADSLLGFENHLEAWRWGDLDEATSQSLIEALSALEQNAMQGDLSEIAASARGLARAHSALGEETLTEELLESLRRSHETLLSQIDSYTIGQPVVAQSDQLDELRTLVSAAAADAGVGSPAMPDSSADIESESISDLAPAADHEPVSEPHEAAPVDEGVTEFETDANQLSDESDEFDLAELLTDGDLEIAEPNRSAELAGDAGDTELASTAPAPEAADPEAADNEELDGVSAQALSDSAEEAVQETGETTDEPVADIAEVDLELVDVFFEEADEILEGFDASLQDWLGERDNGVHLENLLRGLHTLKGGARLAGLMRLGDETHGLESFLIDSQTNGADYDQAFFVELQGRHENLLTLLADIRRHLTQAQQAPVEPAKRESAGSAEPQSPAPSDAAAEMSAPVAEAPRATAPVEMVRVSSNLLEDLVNLAGESSIMRARIEQSISDFGGALDEMETTIDRVREQLRRLEIETEAQVHFRSESQGPAYSQFDPLEMDRYNQLQELSRSLTESASDMLDLKETLQVRTREAETLLLQQGRLNTELQEGLMRTRMVPFSRLLPRLRRIVRQIGRELDKQVEFHAYNAEGELDRTVLERMVPPLEHMLRNAVDHGIESAEMRRGYSKPDIGRIELRLSREGGDVVIEISDDGSGIDIESVRAKATERGLMAADAELTDEEILEFVLAPGFTTAKSVTQISGRGVGMDVVHSEVKQLGGSIEIASQPRKGTRFTVRLPFTVSVNRALMVSVADDLYAIPLNTIEGIVLLSEEELAAAQSDAGGFFEYAGVPYRVRYLGNYIGRDYGGRSDASSVPVVLVRSGDHAVAVHVDAVQGSREIVVKSLGPQFAGVGGISGATILGDGNVVVILDLVALIRAQGIEGSRQRARPRASRAEVRTVMVVDDSVTVRKVTSRLLERQGMEVIVAKDGVEAIALLQEQRPDVMLLDIEMPRMDGFEVARQIRHDDRLSRLPIVMITSRTGQKHQQHAREVGVNQFLGKPFQEAELLATIDELVH